MGYYDSMTILNFAVAIHDIESINKLLNDNNINSQDKYGRSPLHIACDKEDYEIIKILLSYKACDVNLLDAFGKSPLRRLMSHDQIYDDIIPIVELLIKFDADVNSINNVGDSILERACLNYTYGGCGSREQNAKIINLLISHGADCNAKFINSWAVDWFRNHDAGIISDLQKSDCLIYPAVQSEVSMLWEKIKDIMKIKKSMRCPACYGEKEFPVKKKHVGLLSVETYEYIEIQKCELCNGAGKKKEYDKEYFADHCGDLNWNEKICNSKLYNEVQEILKDA